MLLYDENLQQLDAVALRTELLNSLDTVDVPLQADLENDLGQYYNDAQSIDSGQYGIDVTTQNFSAAPTGGTILDKIKAFICSILTDASSDQDIIDAILKALGSIIPGGIIFQFIAKELVKFILNLGIGAFCPVPAAIE